jgi:cyclopropane-fatty-acyl-phospholipid synthase
MDAVLEAVERGLVPDALVLAGIRRLVARKLADEHAGGKPAIRARYEECLSAMRAAPIALHTHEANSQHYEVPAAYFERVLGPRLKYSCAFWDGARDLAEAEEAMLRLTAERAALADGQQVLELGCGWGSLTLWMAERFPASHITAVSNSRSQREYIEGRARERGLANVRVLTADMNTFAPPEAGRYNRVVSVEMFEHMRNWEALLARIRGWLEPDGSLFVHVFCLRDAPYFFEVGGQSDWMARHFFTGGLMPAEDLLQRCASGWRLDGRWRVDGTHYARTSRAWLARHDAARGEIEALFATVYGARDAARWSRRWRLFHMACAELFDHDGGSQWFVTHARLSPAGLSDVAPVQAS